jgi:hypothetical protein
MLRSAIPGLRKRHVSLGRDMLFVKDDDVNNPKTRRIVEEKEEAVLSTADAFVRASAGSRLEKFLCLGQFHLL